MRKTPNGADVRGSLVNEISNFRFKSKPCDLAGDAGWRTPAITVSGGEMSYVQRRKSEIEARLSGADVVPVDYRKYSEGSLTFSKIPCDFLFGHEKRHVVFDSKNLHFEKRRSSADVSPWKVINGSSKSAANSSVSLTDLTSSNGKEEDCAANNYVPGEPAHLQTSFVFAGVFNRDIESDQNDQSILDSSSRVRSANDSGKNYDSPDSADSDDGSTISASTLDVEEFHSMPTCGGDPVVD